MDFASPAASWAYQQLSVAALERSRPDWPGATGFRRLVEALAACPSAAQLYATLSHNALVVSPASRHAERARRPRFVIEPLEGTARVRRYAKSGCAGVSERPYGECWPEVAAALAWLLAP